MSCRLAPDSRLVAAAFVLVLGASAAVASGLADRLAPDGEIDRRSAIGAALAYWLVLFAAVWLIPRALRHPRQSALSLAATLLSLGVAEVASRALIPRTTAIAMEAGGLRSHEFHHIYPAHTRLFMGRFEGRDVFLETNEDGLRTTYSKDSFAQHHERIVILGDSFTFGIGVAADEAAPAALERHLRSRTGSDSIAVLNAGIISYSPFLQRRLFERKLAAYRPTLVLLLLDVTDIGDDYRYAQESELSSDGAHFPFNDTRPPKYRGAVRELMRPYERRLLAALRYPLTVAASFTGSGSASLATDYDYYDFRLPIGGVVERNRFFLYRHPLHTTRPLFDRMMGSVDAIAARAEEIGAEFLLVITPRFHHWNPAEAPENWERGEYRLDEPFQFEYFRYFQELDRAYPILDLLSDFQRTRSTPLVFRDDPHWNAVGHAFVAETIARHLLSMQLVGSWRPHGSSAARPLGHEVRRVSRAAGVPRRHHGAVASPSRTIAPARSNVRTRASFHLNPAAACGHANAS